jgi:hypothetical protein
MRALNAFTKILQAICMLLTLTGCQDDLVERSNPLNGGKTFGGIGDGHPDDLRNNPGESYPFPEIIATEYIPRDASFDDMKCLAWRITWPEYDSDYDRDLIPTVFSISDGQLHSFNYLNNTVFHNTSKATMSLYVNAQVETAKIMWLELDYAANNDNMQYADFIRRDVPLNQLQEWVEARPQLFKTYYEGTLESPIDYEEGDFMHFYLNVDKRYGGIRIVSMTPRIIEVYLAVPNL